MKNLRVTLNFVDGSHRSLDCDTGKELVQAIYGQDFSAPPSTLLILGETDEGQTVSIRVPYDERTEAHITVDLAD